MQTRYIRQPFFHLSIQTWTVESIDLNESSPLAISFCLFSALAEKLQAVVPITSTQMVRPVALVANLTSQSGNATSGLQSGATPQQLAAAAQAGQQAAHQLMSALAAQNSAVSAASGVNCQVQISL